MLPAKEKKELRGRRRKQGNMCEDGEGVDRALSARAWRTEEGRRLSGGLDTDLDQAPGGLRNSGRH